MEQGHWEGAQAWFARGLRLAEAAEATLEIGRLQHRLGRLVWKRGDRTAAVDHVRRARECFEAAADANEMALVLSTQGQLDAEQGRTGTAVAAYREALAWARRASEHEGGLEVTIRLNLARLLFETDRLLAYRPGRVLTMLGGVICLQALGIAILAFAPVLPVAILLNLIPAFFGALVTKRHPDLLVGPVRGGDHLGNRLQDQQWTYGSGTEAIA